MLKEDRWNYYYNQDYGSKWHRGNRGDHVTGCTDPDSYVCALDIHKMSTRKVVPAVRKLCERLAKMPDITVLNQDGTAFESTKGAEKHYFKFFEVLQKEWQDAKGAWNLFNGFGVAEGKDAETVVADRTKNHSKGEGLTILYQIPDDMTDGSMYQFRRMATEGITYDTIVKENPKVREFLSKVLSEAAFNKFYGIKQEKPAEEKPVHQEVEVTARGRALVRDFWKAQKAVKQHEVNPLSYSDWEDLKKFLDTDEGYTAFGKYYNYAKKLVGSWLGESKELDLTKAMEILKESGIKIENT